MVLMALVDSNYKFTVVDVGAFGSNSDGGVWKMSQFGAAFDAGFIEIPPPKSLPGTHVELPHVLIGDEAFQLRNNFMRPYPGKQLDDQRRIYNYRLSRARYVNTCSTIDRITYTNLTYQHIFVSDAAWRTPLGSWQPVGEYSEGPLT